MLTVRIPCNPLPVPFTIPKVIETLAMELAAAGTVGAGEGDEEAADSVSLETVRDKLEAALEEETRVVGEGEEVKTNTHTHTQIDPER